MSGYYPGYGGVSGGEMPSQPDFAAALSRLGAMTNEQLQELLDNDQKCEELVKSLDQVSSDMGKMGACLFCDVIYQFE